MMKRFLSVPTDWLALPCVLTLSLAFTGCSDEGETPVPETPDVPEEIDPTTAPPQSSSLDRNVQIITVAQNGSSAPTPAPDITVMEGYQVENLYTTDKPEQGSWVALCAGPNGTLYASAQGGRNQGTGIFHIAPAAIGDDQAQTQIIKQPIEIVGAQGLCYAFDALYVMESNVGVQRVTDSDGDGLLDTKELLVRVRGGGEHGTHAIVPTADGEGLYIIGGNMTPMPAHQASFVPEIWDEDQVLQREPDARGHASGLLAPGGWIGRMNPDGSHITIVCNGFRNAYDFDVAPNGEIFAYDADMEWDLGMPWYRPTRINHVSSGAEFGWRNGSGKWPTYFEDSLPAVVEIGPGSPVGVAFGTGASFPARYQQALFVLDWTYGTIYAIHLSPDGATYSGELEQFVYGKPLPLTDVAIADDGAMYFTTGGRGMDSSIYRVTYVGDEDTSATEPTPLTAEAQLRRQIETLHTPDAPADAIAMIWDNLNHEDRFIRFAARVALEHQPVDRYIDRAKAETDPLTRTAAGLALARHNNANAMEVLLGVTLDPANDTLCAAWTRAVGVVFARREGAPADALRDAVLAKLEGLLATQSMDVKTEIVRLRVYLEDPTVIGYALALMNDTQAVTPQAWIEMAAQNDRYGPAIRNLVDNPPPTPQFGIAFMLRNITEGWTIQTRQAYFSWLNVAARGAGGNSYQGYVARVREQAIATLTEDETRSLGDLLNPPAVVGQPAIALPQGPGRPWNVAMATATIERVPLNNQDFDRGVGLYQGITCSQCHRVGNLGGTTGPDLTSVALNFSTEDLMRAIIEPNAAVSDQYRQSMVKTTTGREVIGRILVNNDQVVSVQPDPHVDATVDIPRGEVESIEEVTASLMPAGLMNPLSAQELRDLTAYLLSGGERSNEMFAQPAEEAAE